MTTPCPHCWPPEAQQLAAENATIAALQVENARLTRELAEHDASQAMPATYQANWNAELARAVIRTKLGAREDETLWDCVNRVARENAALRARVISQHALIASQRRIRTVLIAALRRQAARLRALGDV